MYSLEKLKELAVKQMRMAADLYETIEAIEASLTGDNEAYNKLLLRTQRDNRQKVVAYKYGLAVSTEEKDLWDEAMEELD